MRKIKFLFFTYQLYKYIIFYPILGGATAFFGSVSVLLSIFINQKIGSIMGVLWARVCSYATPMFVKTVNLYKIDPKQSYVIVSNHQSLYDILVVYGWLPVDFKWVMKIELRAIPFLGYACDRMGHIYIDRSNSQAALASINKAKDRIKNGTSVFFFPEGQRSTTGELLEFKKGAFKFALDLKLPILPVSIVDTKKILPNLTSALFPGKVKMIIHDPIKTDNYNDGNITELIKKAKEEIKKGLTP